MLGKYIQKKGGVSVLANPNTGNVSKCMLQSTNAWRSGVPRIPLVTMLWSNQLNRLSSVAAEFWRGAARSTDEVADLILVALKSH